VYSHNDILIVGDSWCAERSNYDHWPKLLYSELTNDDKNIPRGKGYSGCAWWSVRKRLLAEFKLSIPKLVIICHTDYSRIPNDNDMPITVSGAFRSLKPKYSIDNPIYKSAASYYNHLYSKNFHLWAQQQWYHELDYILNYHNIEKVIHLFGFPPEGKMHLFKAGLTVKDPLTRYLITNVNSIKWDNHMTPENNHRLALSLLEIIKNYPEGGGLYDKHIMDGGNDNIKNY
jgi:hypothetical protein